MESTFEDDPEHIGAMITTEEDTTVLRFFLLGKTGSGKSATGNTILGRDRFRSEVAMSSVTTNVEIQGTVQHGVPIKIMDTPGLCDTNLSETEIASIIVKAVATLHPGPHVLLFTIRLGRYTSEDHGVYMRLKALLDDRIKDHIVVVFTHGECLQSMKAKSIHQVVDEGPENLKRLMADCNNRYVVFNNNADDKQSQVSELMNMVLQLKNDNENQPYQCPKYAYVTEKIEEEARKRLEEVEKVELERNQYYKKLEERLNQKDKELEEMRQQLKRKEEELDRREREEMKELMETIRRLEGQLEEANQKMKEEKEDKNLPHQSPEQPNEEQQKQNAELAEKIAKMNDDLEKLKHDLQEKTVELEQRESKDLQEREKIEIILKEKQEVEGELHQVRKQTEDEVKRAKEAEEKNAELEREKKRLEKERAEIRKLLDEAKQMEQEREELRKQLQEQKRQAEEFAKEKIVQLENERLRAEKERDETERRNQELKVQINNQPKSGICCIL